MKNYLARLLSIVLVSVLIIGCETEDSLVNESPEITKDHKNDVNQLQENIVDISHHYSYQGKEFSVMYTLDQKERNVLKVSGDIDKARAVFGRQDSPKALLFDNQVTGSKEIVIQVFDTDQEMNRYLEKNGKLPKETFDQSKSCSSFNYYGFGSFYFYKHAYYNTEMLSMRRTSTRATGNHWVGSANNDNLSSIRMGIPINTQGFLTLREHICYGGKSLNFYMQDYTTSLFWIPNLQWYTLSGWWWWQTSWNDQVSSYGAWCWS